MITDIEFVVGIDNGVTGGIAILSLNSDFSSYILSKNYTNKFRDYTKKEKFITRIDVNKMYEIIKVCSANTLVMIERPMINPTRFVASISASRALESTLIVLEKLNFKYRFCDSKEWQKYFFNNQKIQGNTKELSKYYGKKIFPQYSNLIDKQDADALLIALWSKNILKEGKIENY